MRPELNQITIIGNVTQEPTKRVIGDKLSCRFSIASVKNIKENGIRKEKVTFIKIKTYDDLAEVCSNLIDKGQQVLVVGELTYRKYEHKGVMHVAHEIKARTVQLL